MTATAGWYAERRGLYRGAGAVAAAVPVRDPASPLDRLVASFGRDPAWSPVGEVVRRFGAAWEAWDLDAIMSLMADDAVFESTGPAPDGRRVEGAAAIRTEWAQMFASTHNASFTFEEAFVAGDRATARWVFAWTSDDGTAGHVRGTDVLRVATAGSPRSCPTSRGDVSPAGQRTASRRGRRAAAGAPAGPGRARPTGPPSAARRPSHPRPAP